MRMPTQRTLVILTVLLTTFSANQIVRAQSKSTAFECAGCDLRGVDMSTKKYLDRNLSGAILREANLRGANLSNIVFLGADLRGADLRGSTLTNTFFTGGANLQKADLRGARMDGTFFTNADLRNADLRGATLTKGSLESANLSGAKIDGLVMDAFLSKTIMPDGKVRNDNCP